MRIAQITDTHFVEKGFHWFSEPATALDSRLRAVIDTLNALDPQPELVLLTGDATDRGDVKAYDHLRQVLEGLRAPYYVIPGNHDCRENMRQAFADQPYFPKAGFLHYRIERDALNLIGLDTHVPQESYGELCEERLNWLARELEESKKPTLLFMHHPPIPVGIKAFDKILCRASARFTQLLERSPQVIALLTGHYHHLCVGSFAGKVCYLAPSVAPVHYFEYPQNDEPTALELQDPAISLHHWTREGGLTTQVMRVQPTPKRIDWAQLKLISQAP